MSYYLFLSILFILLLHHCGCGGATVQEAQMMTTTVVGSSVHTATTTQDGLEKCSFNGFTYPFLVATDDVIAVISAANCSDNSAWNIDIVAKYIETGDSNERSGGDNNVVANLLTSDSTAGWKTEIAVRHEEGSKKIYLRSLGAAAGKDKIYFFVRNYSVPDQNNLIGPSPTSENLNVKVVVGTVSGSKGSKTITWTVEDFPEVFKIGQFKEQFGESNLFEYLYAFPIMTENNDIVLAIDGIQSGDKNIYALVHLNDTEGGTIKFEPSFLPLDGVNCLPLFFPWKANKIIVFARCVNSEIHMKESTDLGKTWANTTGSITRLLLFFEHKQGVTLANIENRSVLLRIQQGFVTSDGGNERKRVINFWITDGNRVHVYEHVLTDYGAFFLNDLLYTHGELFSLQQQGTSNTFKDVALTHFNDELARMKFVLKAWENTDNFIVSACESAALSTSFCTSDIIDGLVGFLSNTSDGNNEWVDEYMYVNATVSKGTKVENGFMFSGAAAGAEWSVGRKSGYELYNFTHPGFTLVAGVTINVAIKSKDNSVLGIGFKENEENTKSVGFFCTKDNEWKISGNEGESHKIVPNGKKCQEGKTYKVALILNNSKYSVYVDGEQLGGMENEIALIKPANITHFYFGVDNDNNRNDNVESSVTITNVFLYNRPFTKDEITVFETANGNAFDRGNKKNKNNNTRAGDGTKKNNGGDGGKESSDQPNNPHQSANEESSPQPESSIVRGGVVGVLFSILLSRVPALIYNIIDNV